MDIKVRRTGDFVPEDRSWLASQDGTQNPVSAVIAVPLFTKNTHYPDGVIKSGILLAKATSGTYAGKWGPYSAAASDGREVGANARHLFNSTPVKDGDVLLGVPLMRRGFILQVRLPANHGVDSAAKTALKAIFTYE